MGVLHPMEVHGFPHQRDGDGRIVIYKSLMNISLHLIFKNHLIWLDRIDIVNVRFFHSAIFQYEIVTKEEK